jgi:tetratricopeptide (TPR) repeat protein
LPQLNADISELDAPPEVVMDADTLYQTANARLLDGDFGGARELLREFTQAYPDDAKVGQAWYWLGETHFINGDFQDAADAYIASLQADRQGARAPGRSGAVWGRRSRRWARPVARARCWPPSRPNSRAPVRTPAARRNAKPPGSVADRGRGV